MTRVRRQPLYWRPSGPTLTTACLLALLLVGCFHSDPEPVRTDTVVIPGEWVFEPEVAEVEVGTTVTWTNNGAHTHTVTFDDGVSFDEELSPGDTTQYTFEEAGTYDYVCRYHRPDMEGTVIVVEGNETDTSSMTA